MRLTLASFAIEQTGGGCTALVRYLDDGRVLVLSDGNLGHPAADTLEPIALVYVSADHWNDSGHEAVQTFEADNVNHLLMIVNGAL